jgi:hypothetical protein
MTPPITEQARQIASVAIQEKPASLDSSRASSVLAAKQPSSRPQATICKACGTCYVAELAPKGHPVPCPGCRLRKYFEHERALQFRKMRTLFVGFDDEGFNPTSTLALATDGTIMQAWHHRERKELRWKPLPAMPTTEQAEEMP